MDFVEEKENYGMRTEQVAGEFVWRTEDNDWNIIWCYKMVIRAYRDEMVQILQHEVVIGALQEAKETRSNTFEFFPSWTTNFTNFRFYFL